jgi:hypothetical protein
VTVDEAVGGEKDVCLTRRLEPLHLSLTSSRRPMRIFSMIVEIPVGSMPDTRQNSASRNAVAAQSVSHETAWLILKAVTVGRAAGA